MSRAVIPFSRFIRSSNNSTAASIFRPARCNYSNYSASSLSRQGLFGVRSTLARQSSPPLSSRIRTFICSFTASSFSISTLLSRSFRTTTMASTGDVNMEDAPVVDALPEEHSFDYDFVVIGGGSGGLSAAKHAALNGAKTAVFDFIDPTNHGTTWGLGGTCVNVGCIPKKLMHSAALLGESLHDMESYGWEVSQEKKIDWEKLVESVQNHIMSVNFAYRVEMRQKGVTYINAKASFLDSNTIQYTLKGEAKTLTARRFLVAVGGRPSIPDYPGSELAVTSDDLFSMEKAPGKTLVVGASYVALECAGFLQGLGYDTTTMIRSIPLRGFDQQMAEKIVDYMEHFVKCKFLRKTVPTSIEKTDGGRLKVTYTHDGETTSDEFDTVLMATGRHAITGGIGLDKIGVNMDERNGKIITNAHEQSSIPHIYAVGDCAYGKLELTPSAVQAAKLLCERLFAKSTKMMNYDLIATTVFTPIEYGCVGLTEEEAIAKYGDDNVEVYHMQASPYEHSVVYEREEFPAYLKVITNKNDSERVIGFHVLSPSAGEITQGVGLAMKLGVTKEDLDDTVGIHPTTAELYTTMGITKRSGQKLPKGGCPSCA